MEAGLHPAYGGAAVAIHKVSIVAIVVTEVEAIATDLEAVALTCFVLAEEALFNLAEL